MNSTTKRKEVKSLGYQVPKADHPWRRYKNKARVLSEMDQIKIDQAGRIKPLREFLTEIINAWDRVEIYTSAYGTEAKFKINTLPQHKAAAWLCGILKRNYA